MKSKSFTVLRKRLPAAARAASEREARRIVEAMHLRQLREARKMTQQGLAAELGIQQSEVSRIERRTDLYVSTLSGYLRALGGELDIQVKFPGGRVIKINQFEEAAQPRD